jgi:hypothetical protein
MVGKNNFPIKGVKGRGMEEVVCAHS